MAQSRQCPTRVDGGDPLIAHSISVSLCSKRQREHYHKCYTCTYALGATAVPPATGLLQIPAPADEVEIGSEGAA